MSRKRSRTAQSVSLFPFLAVLVCAMGALIFLLLVTTRRVRLDAVARAHEFRAEERLPVFGPTSSMPAPALASIGPAFAAPARLDQSDSALARRAQLALPSQVDPERRRRELEQEWNGIVAALTQEHAQRLADRDRRAQELSATQRQRDDAERTLATLRQRLQQIEREQQQITSISSTFEIERLALAQQVAETQDRIDKVRRANQSQGSRFAFVPFDGKSGTTRRPILIECTDEAIRFLPEGIELTKSDLDGFTPGFNPVLAGSEALIGHWSSVDRRQESQATDPPSRLEDHQPSSTSNGEASPARRTGAKPASEPYVLLIVRPGGGLAFHIARTFLAQCSQPFGYELIEDDWQLDLPAADPQAADACREAIVRVLAEREKVIGQLGGRSAFARGLRLDRRARGFAFADQDEDPFDPDGRGAFAGRETRRGNGGLTGRGPGTGIAPGMQPGESLRPGERYVGSGRPGQQRANTFQSRSGDAGGMPSAVRRNPSFGDEGQGMTSHGQSTPPGLNESTALQGNGLSDEGRERNWNASLSSSGGDGSRSPANEFSAPSNVGQRAASQELEREQRLRRLPKRWGIDNPRGSIGYERQVEVAVRSDRILVGGEHVVPAGQGESRAELVDQVLATIDRHAKSWGPPPGSFYWVPSVKFVVTPDGNVNYERLHASFQDAGLDTSVQFMLETSDSAGKPETP